MKILLYSPPFYPKIGGLETVVSILAHEFVNQGHDVKVVTQTPEKGDRTFPFEVIRRPNFLQLLFLTGWCDIYFQACVSLKGILPPLLLRKPLCITHQTWYRRVAGRVSWQDHLKQTIAHLALNISASSAIAAYLIAPSVVIPNPYREDEFYEIPDIKRDRELIFLGRLVSDKGADLLLTAVANLRATGLTPRITIVGLGPEEAALKQQSVRLGIDQQVSFVGAKTGAELARLLNQHQILVVPSRWQEPFGIVAVEGIACGCVVVGSEGGGLPEAIGPCGVTFPNGDAAALTHVLKNLLNHPDQQSNYRINALAHLSRHHKSVVAKAYLQLFEEAVQ